MILGIFAYKNPDPVDSYYTPVGSRLFSSETEAELYASNPDEIVNMHSRFILWLKWGFWNFLLALILAMIGMFCQPAGYGFATKAFILSMCSSACILALSVQVWTIVGAIFRFSKSGRLVSGDDLIFPEERASLTREEWIEELREEGY